MGATLAIVQPQSDERLFNSSAEIDEVAAGSDVAVVWIYDSDGANQGFGKKYEMYVCFP